MHAAAAGGQAQLLVYLLSHGGQSCIAQSDDEVPLRCLDLFVALFALTELLRCRGSSRGLSVSKPDQR